MFRTKTIIAAVAGAMFAFGGQEAVAQDGNIAVTYQAKVKSGMVAQFETAIAAHVQWRRDNNDPWTWNTYQVMTGNNINEFRFRSGSHQWADFDQYSAFLAEGAVHFNETVAPYLESITSNITEWDTTHVNMPEDQQSLYNVITFHIAPGQMGTAMEVVAKFHEAATKTSWSGQYGFETVANGGWGNKLRVVIPIGNWAGMAEPDPSMEMMMVQAFGQEEAMAIFEKMGTAITAEESEVVMHRPDLSVNSTT